MFDKVTITYRGAKFEIGRGRAFYGIWTVGASRSQPLQWWPETEEGWAAAWTRFTEIEAPGTITPVGRRTPPVAAGSAQLGQSAASRGGSAASSGGAATALLEDRTAPPRSSDAPPRSSAASFGLAGPPFGTTTAPPRYAQIDNAADHARTDHARTGTVAAALLAVGVVIGIAGLFPAYLAGTSLAAQSAQLVPHAIYLAAWTASAALILLGGVRLRVGALLAVGISAVTFGLFFADAGTAIAGGAHYGGWGLWLSLVGWLACAAGSVVAFLVRPVLARSAGTGIRDSQVASGRRPFLGLPRGAQVGPLVMLVLAGLGAAAAFAPAWDSYTLRTAAGQSQSLTAGNAFSNPGLVITGDVLVMVALAAVVIVAALWRPIQHGAVLLAGAVIPMAAQAISALIQAGQPTSPTQFGISSAEATRLGLTITSGVTPAFWIYCAFLVALVVSCAWMLFTPHEVIGSVPGAYPWNPAAPDAAAPDAAGQSGVRPSAAAEDWDDADDPDDPDDLEDDEAGSGVVPGFETTGYTAPREGDQPTA